MKNIKIIFRRDMKAVVTNFFVLVIALALCILPALYAWFNIYSNWDPYGKTQNIKIAIASDDKGYVNAQGEYEYMGQLIIDSTVKNKKINWVQTNSKDAVNGVKSGKYYAAVVFTKDFSKCMNEGFNLGLKHPQVKYYENEKKNAVATKITDSAVGSLENNINEMYISKLVETVFDDNSDELTENQELARVKKLQKHISEIERNVTAYEKLINSFVTANNKVSGSLDTAKTDLNNLKTTAQRKSSSLSDVADNHLGDNLVTKDQAVSTSLTAAMKNISKAIAEDNERKKTTYYNRAMAYLKDAKSDVNSLLDTLKLISMTTGDSTLKKQYSRLIAVLQNEMTTIDHFLTTLKKNISNDKNSYTSQKEAMWLETIQDLEDNYENVVMPLVENVSQGIEDMTADAAKALTSIAGDIDILKEVLDGSKKSIKKMNGSMSDMALVLNDLSTKLKEINDTISAIQGSEYMQKFFEFLKGDAKGYGEFFSSPVTIETKAVYPVKNYGSGVTPFYTTLALWVGGIFLVALIKVKPRKTGLKNPKPYELFLGRFLLFFVLGQLQTAIIVWGNLCLLKAQCNSPAKFWFASAVASFTFMILIYSLTVSFGDIGKALVVVLVVIQIAGSSGTYPIEILPSFYQKMYLFFPFPYAINAMREAMFGMHANDYAMNLFGLLIFAIAFLALGLVIRLPFVHVNHFVEKRMEDTGFM